MKLSVIIVSYNTKKILAECLSLLKERLGESLPNKDFEVVVVDNASQDGTREYLQEQTLIKSIILPDNLGFGAANNRGAKIANGQYLLFLNSDVYLRDKINFQELISFLDENEKKASLTIKLLLDNGQIDPASHRGFPTPWNSFCYFSGLEKVTRNMLISKYFGGYHLTDRNLKTIHEIDALTAAFFLIKKNVFEKVGGYDERFFMYGEDLDLCYRIKHKQYQIYYYPKYLAHHLKYQSGFKSGNEETTRKMRKFFYEAMRIFYKKHYEKKYTPIINFLVYLGIDIKKLLS